MIQIYYIENSIVIMSSKKLAVFDNIVDFKVSGLNFGESVYSSKGRSSRLVHSLEKDSW